MFLWEPSVGWRRWVERQVEEKTLMDWKSLARLMQEGNDFITPILADYQLIN